MADGDNGKKRVRLSAAEREERLADLVLRRTKLSEDEGALFREAFRGILADHQRFVRRYFLRRGLEEAEAKDATQEVFVSLYCKIVEEGFPDSIRAKVYSLARGAFSNRIRAQQRDPVSIGMPSSGSEPPRTPPDLARAVDARTVAPQLFALLTDDQRDAFELVCVERFSHSEAAEALGIAAGTVKSRAMAAKRRMLEWLAPLLPPSEREPL